MNVYQLILRAFLLISIASCSSEMNLTTNEIRPSSRTATVLGSTSPLLTAVDQAIQDSVSKRIYMDLNPDSERLIRTAQVRRKDIPALDFSSFHFMPSIEVGVVNSASKRETTREDLLKKSKDFACLYGTMTSGKRMYAIARYKDWSKVKQNIESPLYKAAVKKDGKDKIDSAFRKLQSRSGIDCWKVHIFTEGDIMFQLMDYAYNQSDDKSFFILVYGKNFFDVCYFKDGKAFSCRKNTKWDEIRVLPINL